MTKYQESAPICCLSWKISLHVSVVLWLDYSDASIEYSSLTPSSKILISTCIYYLCLVLVLQHKFFILKLKRKKLESTCRMPVQPSLRHSPVRPSAFLTRSLLSQSAHPSPVPQDWSNSNTARSVEDEDERCNARRKSLTVSRCDAVTGQATQASPRRRAASASGRARESSRVWFGRLPIGNLGFGSLDSGRQSRGRQSQIEQRRESERERVQCLGNWELPLPYWGLNFGVWELGLGPWEPGSLGLGPMARRPNLFT